MSQMLRIQGLEGLPVPEAIRRFLTELLENGAVDALLVPKRTPAGNMVAQALVADAEHLDGADPLAPVQMVNAAQVVRELAKEPLEQKIAVVLRPCEIRAVIELVKLKQINPDALYLIGYDCPGVYDIKEYLELIERRGDADQVRGETLERFLRAGGKPAQAAAATRTTATAQAANPGNSETRAGVEPDGIMRSACSLCTHFTADSADLNLAWIEAGNHSLLLEVLTEKGQQLAQTAQGAEELSAPQQRIKRIEAVTARRLEVQEEEEQEDLLSLLNTCIRCYNCREVCPICYCKECLLVPAKMGYSSERYLRRAQKKGQIKMPVDTVLYHLTKMNHMASSCVACGLCEQACPMDIPLGRIYSRVGRNVQALFDYVPGRSLEEEMPVTTFKEEELPGVEDVKR
ncbi:MAG: Coenzyme F420 hydrogenase/dehydrogenase, beta subunit C-terminal domain [Spirochaetia bacterium]